MPEISLKDDDADADAPVYHTHHDMAEDKDMPKAEPGIYPSLDAFLKEHGGLQQTQEDAATDLLLD